MVQLRSALVRLPAIRMLSFLGEIASAFAGIAGVEAVAWCGSTAMQKADFLSDYDLYVYWRTPVALEARKKIIANRSSEYQLDNTFWEPEDEWIEPDGLQFNVIYRSCQEAEEEVHRRLVKHIASLGYTTAYCFSLRQSNNLADSNNWLADLQRQTRRNLSAWPSPRQFFERIGRSLAGVCNPAI